MTWLTTIWKAFTYTNGRFSRSGFMRTIFHVVLVFSYAYAAWVTIPLFGITWEFVIMTALTQGLLIADYRGLTKLRDLKPDSGFGGGGWWGRGRRENEKVPPTHHIEGDAQ